MTAIATPNTVTMKDSSTPFGSVVDFGAKAKTRVEKTIVNRPDGSGTDLTIYWAFRDGEITSYSLFIPAGGHALAAEFQANGLTSKIGDAYTSVSEPADVRTVVQETLGQFDKGRWVKQSSGAPGIAGLTTVLVEALRRTFAQNKPEFADVETGSVLAKQWLVAKYDRILAKAEELRVATGDDLVDAERNKEADALIRKPFASLLQMSADLQRHMAAVKREKEDEALAAKKAALADVDLSLDSFME